MFRNGPNRYLFEVSAPLDLRKNDRMVDLAFFSCRPVRVCADEERGDHEAAVAQHPDPGHQVTRS